MMLDHALAYAARGWFVYPAESKRPLCQGGVNAASTDESVIRNWFKRWPDANIALAPAPSKLIVLDIDGPEGEQSLFELETRRGVRFPATLTSETGHGRHMYFARWARIPSSVGKLGKGLDIRSDGASAVLPPSLHHTGKRYRWVNEGTEIAKFPMAAMLALSPPQKKRAPVHDVSLERVVDSIAQAAEGTRNVTLVKAAFTAGGFVGAGMVSADKAFEELDAAAEAAGLDKHERIATIKSGLKAGASMPFDPKR